MLLLLWALLIGPDPAGLACWHEHRLNDAEAAFRSALARRPSDRLTRVWLARTLLELDRTPEAMNELGQAMQEPVPTEVRFEAGRVLRELAERRLAQLQSVAPDSPGKYELEGERLEWTGDLDGALREYRAAAAKNPERPGIHYRIGNVLWRKRDLEAALAELRHELAITPQHGMANLRAGQALLQGSHARESIPFFERALVAMPESVEARREAGKAYRASGQSAEARAQWEAVAKARPEDDQIHYLLGNLYRDLGDGALSRAELQKHRQILQRRQQHAH